MFSVGQCFGTWLKLFSNIIFSASLIISSFAIFAVDSFILPPPPPKKNPYFLSIYHVFFQKLRYNCEQNSPKILAYILFLGE